MGKNLLIHPLLIPAMLFIVITGCEKDDNSVPVLSTIIVSDITQTTAISVEETLPLMGEQQ